MALRARLSAPRQERCDWPWHQAKHTTVSSSVFMSNERRFEASNFVSGGYGVRLALEARKTGWLRIASVADVSQPARLKGIIVSREFGVPFLNTSQAFAIRPKPRKWLSLDKTPHADSRFSARGDILLLASANVGRSMIATTMHENHIISHHFIRVSPQKRIYRGWLYAFFRSPQARAIMSSSQYGCIIKHLEVSHINALPIPILRDELLDVYNQHIDSMLAKRDRVHFLLNEAEQLFERTIGTITPVRNPLTGFSVRASTLCGRRRRLEGGYYIPSATAIMNRFSELNLTVQPLSDLWEREWQVTRNKSVFGDDGVPYMSADELFQHNPSFAKRILTEQVKDADNYFGKAGWIAMACSGQVYGLNGSVMLLSKKHESIFLSQDLIRIIPRQDRIRPGYLCVALGHPKLGRPLVVRYAYGTSIPHIDPADVGTFPVVRLGESLENQIADFMEEAVKLRAEADDLEEKLVADAEALIDRFIAGDMSDFVMAGKP